MTVRFAHPVGGVVDDLCDQVRPVRRQALC